jgi:putative aldouronate transport system permease protein
MSLLRKKKIEGFDIIVTLVVLLMIAIVLYPIILILSYSISDPTLVARGEVLLFPKRITFAAYKRVFQDPSIMLGYANTIFYTVTGTILNLVVTVPAGYVLSKKNIPGLGFFMKAFLFTMYFSGGMIPMFLLIRSLGLYDTRTILVIIGAFNVYNCIICRTFFAGLPKEIEEAAYIDGAGITRTFVEIILPLSKALLGVMVLYFVVDHWNAYFSAMMYTNSADLQPLQLVLRKILVLQESSKEMMASGGDELLAKQEQIAALIKYAVIVVSTLPLMILYPFLQKYFEKGVMIGSVKG